MSPKWRSTTKDSQTSRDSVSSTDDALAQDDASVCAARRRAALFRKIDWQVMPFLCASNMVTVLDKTALNFANIMGLQQDLHMGGQDLSWLATAFSVAYTISGFLQGYLLQCFPVGKVLGVNLFLMAIALCGAAASTNYSSIMGFRVMLGVCEAAVIPSTMLMTSQWYPKRRAALRTGAWASGSSAGFSFGALISFIVQHVHTQTHFSSWRIMFLSMGSVNILLAFYVLFFVPGTIDNARFLTTGEKETVKEALLLDQSGNGHRFFEKAGLLEALLDPAVLLLLLLNLLATMQLGGLGTFSASMVQGFGYPAEQVALLTLPCGLLAGTASLGGMYAIRHGTPRWLVAIVALTCSLVGFSLLMFASIKQARVAGLTLTQFNIVVMTIVYSFAGANTSGYTKRVTVNAALQIGSGIAQIISPQIFRSQEAPRYMTANVVFFACLSASIFVVLSLRLVYGRRNRKSEPLRRAQLQDLDRDESVLLVMASDEDRTDLKNPAFVYRY